MYEVSQNVDLSLKVDALSKKFDQLLVLNTLPTNSPNVQGLEAKTQILDSHTQSTSKLETHTGKLANAISRRDEDELPSHPIEDPRANYHEQAKVAITLRNGKLVDNKVRESIKDSEINENESEGIDMGTKIEEKIEKELASSSNSKTLKSSPMTSYKQRALVNTLPKIGVNFSAWAKGLPTIYQGEFSISNLFKTSGFCPTKYWTSKYKPHKVLDIKI
ncbi:hypothetical protein M9H77_07735 [Catharanthus roseus]|uniref:Uncharacterized protein n=1 Tax=Catharanthus roseus TaxID=4058 RepID=A0ACC0BVZ9_CATRO|nr:hypothetical protein M9H77_07735 [Catharanthus roseus]